MGNKDLIKALIILFAWNVIVLGAMIYLYYLSQSGWVFLMVLLMQKPSTDKVE